MSTDGLVGLVEDRPRREQRLDGLEGVLHGEQVAITQGDLESQAAFSRTAADRARPDRSAVPQSPLGDGLSCPEVTAERRLSA